MGHKCLLDSARLSVASREEMGFGQVTGETCSCTTKTDEKELATKMERNKKEAELLGTVHVFVMKLAKQLNAGRLFFTLSILGKPDRLCRHCQTVSSSQLPYH